MEVKEIPLTVEAIEQEVAAASTVTTDVLQAELNGLLYQIKALNLRIAGAQAAKDEQRLVSLKEELKKADGAAAQFRQILSQDFPKYTPTEPDYTEVTQAVIVGEYIDAVRNQRDVQLSSRVAKGMALDDRVTAAFEMGKKYRLYLDYYKPKYDKVLKALSKKETA